MTGFIEFFVVLAFAIGWIVLEWRLNHLDRRYKAERETQNMPSNDTEPPPSQK